MQHDEPTSASDLFWAVARRLRHASRETLAPWDVTPSQLRALGSLMRHGSMRPGGLAQHLGIAPRSATEVVDDLQRLGLVERRPDPADRRAVLVALTAEGDRTSSAIQQAREAEGARFFAALDEADRADLARVLTKLRDDA